MKKKLFCLILSLVLAASVLPFGAVRASAASERTYSEDVVQLIKDFEGFVPTAYQYNGRWTIGYGTPSTQGATITEEQAEAKLREVLKNLDTKVNQFASTYGVNLSQNQHDALLSLSYNCGTDWATKTGRLHNAVVNGASEEEFLFAISLWANVNKTPDTGLLNRRMAEANLYLNGTYSKSRPSDFAYVILNPNGGTAGNGGEDKMQGYNVVYGTKILAQNPTKSGSTFGGWFTAASGGNHVSSLDASVAGKALYAQYGKQVKVTSDYVNVRSGAGTNNTQVDTLYKDSTVVIVATTKVGDALWGRYADGWIALEYTNYSGGVESDSSETATGTVTANLNVRAGAGTNYVIVGAVTKGTKVTIYETTTVNGVKWGRIGTGRWVSLQYVTLDSPSIWEGGESSDEYTYGTVTGSAVNVRKAAGVTNAVVGTVYKNERIKIYEQTTVSNTPWGRTDKGWVCMNYVKLDAPAEKEEETEESEASGVTTANVNVRAGAGTNYAIVGAAIKGTKVTVYETTTVNGVKWGRIGQNRWVCLSYVKLDGTATEETEETGVVNTANLNVRSGAGTNYTKVRTLTAGEKVTIYEKTTVNGQVWGRIGAGEWVCLSYVKLNGTAQTSGAYWVNAVSGLRIRSGAGTGYSVVGSYPYRADVTVLETKTVGTVKWGRTDRGWVCMSYLTAGTGVSWT